MQGLSVAHQPSPIKADFIVFSRPSQSWEGDYVSLNRSQFWEVDYVLLNRSQFWEVDYVLCGYVLCGYVLCDYVLFYRLVRLATCVLVNSLGVR